MSLQILAKDLAAKGRNNDTLLVHMTPGEVNSLQGLAQAHGGSLTVNPDTGLPEAGFLDGILEVALPMAAGFALGPAGFGLTSSLGAAGIVGGVTGLLEGDLGKGLMAGLGAYGGSSLGSAWDPLGNVAGNTAPTAAQTAQATQAAKVGQAKQAASNLGTNPVLQKGPSTLVEQSAQNAAPMNYNFTVGSPTTPFGPGQVPLATTPTPAAPPSAAAGSEWYKNPWLIGGAGVLGAGALAGQQEPWQPPVQQSSSNYDGIYVPQDRDVSFGDPLATSSEYNYFTETNPVPGYKKYGMAAGGLAALDDGAFVVDARTVSELGNGSSSAGIELLSQLGGTPVQGEGDGVSDSIPATIDGEEEIRIARDEVIFSPEALANLGGGDEKKGAQQLYALMDKAKAARQKADRGEDTQVAKQMGLGGLTNAGNNDTV